MKMRTEWSRVATSTCTALFVLGATASNAQNVTEVQSDFASARSDALLGTSTSPANAPLSGSLTTFGVSSQSAAVSVQPFNFNFIGPVGYARSDGGGKPDTDSLEGTPELKLGFKYRPGEAPIQLSGFIDSDSDRYTGSATPSDKLDANLRVDWIGTEAFPARDRLIPYLSYSPTQSFDPFFSKGTKFTEDLTLGGTKLWDFGPDWLRIDTRASAVATWEFGLAGTIQRRIVSKGADSTAFTLGPSIKWTATNKANWPHILPEDIGSLSASVAFNVTRRLYEDTTKGSERDWGLQPIATVAWVLPSKWFGHSSSQFGSPELDFQAAYNALKSNISGNNSEQWAIGPAIRAGWTF